MLKREIYAVRFNKCQVKNDIMATTYTVGEVFLDNRGKRILVPVSIDYANKTKKDRLLITFKDGLYHEIGITPEVELFWRNIEMSAKASKTKKETTQKTNNGTDITNRTHKRST